jgi:Domain of unknown function (DUF305)
MNWLPRSLVLPGAFAIAVIFVVGAALVISAHDGTPLEPDICSTAGFADSAEAPFLAENEAAMTKMMRGMAARPSGNVDADFVAMMVPHHQGAIEMAIAVLRHGRNPRIRRLAQEIIVTQQEEIAAMALAIGKPLPASATAPTQQFDSTSSSQ